VRLLSATVYALRIPFLTSVRYSLAGRAWSDSVVVRVLDADGVEGFGEADLAFRRRIHHEERVLAAGLPGYRAYMTRTGALLPRLGPWSARRAPATERGVPGG
jgi:protein-S-isoprenylcysteine O-methyltransferase Ste14